MLSWGQAADRHCWSEILSWRRVGFPVSPGEGDGIMEEPLISCTALRGYPVRLNKHAHRVGRGRKVLRDPLQQMPIPSMQDVNDFFDERISEWV